MWCSKNSQAMLPPKKRKTYESQDDSRVAVPKQVKAYVNRAIRNATEVKYVDFVINGTASTSGSYTAFLDAIALGTAYNQRVGDHVKFRRMEWDLRVVPGDNFNFTRCIIGATRDSTHTGIPGAITSLDSGTDPTFGPYLLDRKLYTQFKPVDGSTNTTVGEYKFIKGAKKLNHSVQYPQSGNNPSNWMFYFQFHSDSTLIPHPGVYGNIRVYYTDK